MQNQFTVKSAVLCIYLHTCYLAILTRIAVLEDMLYGLHVALQDALGSQGRRLSVGIKVYEVHLPVHDAVEILRCNWHANCKHFSTA